MLTLQHIAQMQQQHRKELDITYYWEPYSDTPQAKIKKVWISFRKPHANMWKWIMTQTTDGFEIQVSGTRNKPHDGLDDCYCVFLDEVNKERVKIGLERVSR